MITQERLKELFDYNPVTGHFQNRFSRGRAKEGERAGSPTGHGYRRIIIDYQKCYEHHMAWLYVHGKLPKEMDHKDGNRSNNALCNLRPCTRTQNNYNRTPADTSGLRGAYLDKRTMRWYSHICFGGQVIHLGMFGAPEEAHKAFMVAAERYHGEFAYRHRPEPFIRRI